MQKTILDKPSPLPLDQVLPDGQVVNRAWLEQGCFHRSRIDFYLPMSELLNPHPKI